LVFFFIFSEEVENAGLLVLEDDLSSFLIESQNGWNRVGVNETYQTFQ